MAPPPPLPDPPGDQQLLLEYGRNLGSGLGDEEAQDALVRAYRWPTEFACLEALLRGIRLRLTATPDWAWSTAEYKMAELRDLWEAELGEAQGAGEDPRADAGTDSWEAVEETEGPAPLTPRTAKAQVDKGTRRGVRFDPRVPAFTPAAPAPAEAVPSVSPEVGATQPRIRFGSNDPGLGITTGAQGPRTGAPPLGGGSFEGPMGDALASLMGGLPGLRPGAGVGALGAPPPAPGAPPMRGAPWGPPQMERGARAHQEGGPQRPPW